MPKELIIENEKLIYSISKKLYGVEKEDLIQAGFLGLLKAYNNYDETRGVKFSTYAYGFIYGEMYEAATGNRPIRVRKNEMHIYKSVLKGKSLLEEKCGHTISYEDACTILGVDYTLFMSILNSLSATVSVDDRELNLAKKSNLDDMILLRESLNNLSPLEKSIIEKRYMEDMSQMETAKVLGLSQVKVSRIEKKSREKIRNFVSS